MSIGDFLSNAGTEPDQPKPVKTGIASIDNPVPIYISQLLDVDGSQERPKKSGTRFELILTDDERQLADLIAERFHKTASAVLRVGLKVLALQLDIKLILNDTGTAMIRDSNGKPVIKPPQ